MSLLDDLLTCETTVWEALVRGDAQVDSDALDEEFLGIYPDGFAGKADHVDQLTDGPTVVFFALSGARVLPLAEGVALLSYRAVFRRVDRMQDEGMFVSSIWRHTGARWVNIFSQDTPAQDTLAQDQPPITP